MGTSDELTRRSCEALTRCYRSFPILYSNTSLHGSLHSLAPPPPPAVAFYFMKRNELITLYADPRNKIVTFMKASDFIGYDSAKKRRPSQHRDVLEEAARIEQGQGEDRSGGSQTFGGSNSQNYDSGRGSGRKGESQIFLRKPSNVKVRSSLTCLASCIAKHSITQSKPPSRSTDRRRQEIRLGNSLQRDQPKVPNRRRSVRGRLPRRMARHRNRR